MKALTDLIEFFFARDAKLSRLPDLNWIVKFRDISHHRIIPVLTNSHLQALRFFCRKRAVPLNYWLCFRSALERLCPSSDPLFSTHGYLQNSGAVLPIQDLVAILRDDMLGGWALDGDTISFLWKLMQQDRPRVIVECGAGVSTLVFAKSLHEFAPTKFTSLLSLEQNLWVKEKVEKRLVGCGLNDGVTVLHTPISEKGDYQLDADQLRDQLGSEKVDWVIIDGPAGPEGCRASTLPLLARFCRSGARWFLDDAFRDGELGALNRWTNMSGITVYGIYPIGKGLGAGIVQEPERLS